MHPRHTLALIPLLFACGGVDAPEATDAGGAVDASAAPPTDAGVLDAAAPQAPTEIGFVLGSEGLDYGKDIAVAADGDLLVTGYFGATVDFDPSVAQALATARGATDVFVARYSADGEMRWRVAFGGLGADMPHTVAEAPDGSLWLTGFVSSGVDLDPGPGEAIAAINGARDAFVLHLDADGEYLDGWALGGPDGAEGCMGTDPTCDEGNELVVGSDGAIHVVGHFNGTVDFDPGPSEVTRTAAGDAAGFVAKYTSDGALEWVRMVDGPRTDSAVALDVGADGAVTAAVTFMATADVEGSASPMPSEGGMDSLVARYDATGAHVWQASLSGAADVVVAPGGLDVTIDDDVLLTGRFAGVGDFDPGPDTRALTSAGSQDLFVVRLGARGAHVWSVSAGGARLDGGHRVEALEDGRVVVAGWARGTLDLGPVTASPEAGADTMALVLWLDASGAWLDAVGLGGPVEAAGADTNLAAGMSVRGACVYATGRTYGATQLSGALGPEAEWPGAGRSDVFVWGRCE